MHGELWVTPGREGQTSSFMAQLHLILFCKSTLPHFLCGTRSQVYKNRGRKEKQGTMEPFFPRSQKWSSAFL